MHCQGNVYCPSGFVFDEKDGTYDWNGMTFPARMVRNISYPNDEQLKAIGREVQM